MNSLSFWVRPGIFEALETPTAISIPSPIMTLKSGVLSLF